MKIKKALSCILMLSFVLGGAQAISVNAAQVTPYFYETYDEYASNVSISGSGVENAVKSRIVEETAKNKALLVEGNTPVLKKEFGKSITEDFVVSFDIRSDSTRLSVMPGIYTSLGTELFPVKIVDNEVKTDDNKLLSTIAPGKYLKLAYIFNLEFGVCDVYIDKKLVASNIPVANINLAQGMIVRVTNSGGKVYFDNLLAYPSDRLLSISVLKNYNSDALDYIDINDYTGSFEYWNMYYMNTSKKAFQFVTMYPKDNEIECPWLDYTNKNKENYIKLTKTTANDCYFDIILNDRHKRLGPAAQIYKYFVFEGDFMTSGGITNSQLPMLRDSVTYSSNCDSTVAAIKGKNIVLSDGTVIANVVNTGEWFNYKLAINLVDATVSVYINGVERVKDSPIVCSDKTKAIEFLSRARVCLQTGSFTADLKMKNCKFTGYEKPYVHGEDPKTSIYYDDAPVAEYLKDKIAFHAYARNMLVNGMKYDISDSMSYDEENDEIYVKASVLNDKLSWEFADDADMIAVKDYAQKNNYYAASNKNGLILLSQKEMRLDAENEYQWYVLKPWTSFALEQPTTLEAIDDYVFFERPSADELLEDMRKCTDNLTAHPRIYADKNRFDEMRNLYKTDATFKEWADKIIKTADTYADDSTPLLDYVYQDAIRMQSLTHAQYQRRFTALGFAYQMTGDKKYPERAWKEFEVLTTFPDINPSHIIDSGCMNEGVALGYDWMYDAYTPQQRKTIEDFVLKHCIKAIADGFYGLFSAYCTANEAWYSLKATNNYNMWVLGGLFEATCAFMECDPEYLSDVAEKCIRGLEYPVKGFAPDGGWIEGPDYWSHTTQYMMAYAGAAFNCFGSDYNILQYQGISEAPYYIMSIDGLLGINNYADAGDVNKYTYSQYSFYSKYFDTKDLGSLRKYDITQRKATPEFIDLIYYDPDIGINDFDDLPKVKTTRGVETCGIRQSFTDKNGMFFSAKGGRVKAYHTHYDVGSFIFDLNGVRWAHDLGKDDYNTGLYDSQMFRKRSEAHNTISMNIGDSDSQIESAYAPILSSDYNDHSAYITYDMTDIYAETDSFTRGFYIGDDYRSLTIRDEISLNRRSQVLWTMNTKADVSLWGNEAMLYQNGEALHVRVECDAEDWEFVDMPCESLASLPGGATATLSNSEYTKLAIKINSAGSFHITVKLAAENEPGDLTAVDTTPISDWTLSENGVSESSDVQKITANIYADGTIVEPGDIISVKTLKAMPEIKVEPLGAGASYEIVQAAKDASEKTVIKVYNSDKSRYTLYVIKYSDADIDLWRDYNVLDITEYSVSQQLQEENAAPNMFDGKFSTRWTSLNTGEYVTVDLGSMQNVAGIAMGFWQSEKRGYNYVIQISKDGVKYKTVSTGTSPLEPEGYHIYDFEPEMARYVKIIGMGNTSNVNTNILELRILGSK